MDFNKLAQMAQEIMNSGFNPQTDEVQAPRDLPDGVYDAVLSNVEWRNNDTGFEWLHLEFDILTPGFENRKYFAMHSFNNEAFLETNIKHVMQSASVLDVMFNPAMLMQPETQLTYAFRTALGKQVDLKLDGWENKKKGTKGQNFRIGMPGTL